MMVRVTALVDEKSCKIEKVAYFIHFEQKNTHINGCKIVHLLHNFYSNRAYMHGYCSTCIYYFISFFSLLLSDSLVALTLTSHSLPPIIRECHTMHQ